MLTQTFLKPINPTAQAYSRAATRHSCHQSRRSIGNYLKAGLVLALLTLKSLAALAHETDQYTVPLGRQFADLGPYLSRSVYDAIAEAVKETNAAIRRSLWDNRPTNQTAPLQSPEFVVGQVWVQLFAAFPTNEILDDRLAAERIRARYPGLITVYRPEQSIYDDPLLMLDPTKLIRLLFRASTISADGKVFGTDKIIHFIHMGSIYHASYVSARKQGLGEWEAVTHAVQLSSGNNLFLSENWLLGTATTGIRSNADLAANYAGFKFYRNLTEAVRIGNQVMPPMLVQEGLYWRLNDQVQSDSEFFTAFITPHWNEALNPNVYAILTDTRVRAMLRTRCPDLLDWYRDERGSPLSRRQFAQIEQELSTFYGEEYGYENEANSTVSIATTCFQSAQPNGTRGGSAGADGGDLRGQSLFGLQSGWGQHARVAASPPDRSQEPAVDRFGRTRLWWAAKDGQLQEVERLLAKGADPNAVDIDGEAPLHAAARWGQVAIVEVLVSHGADPNLKALYGMTPLQVSVVEAQLGTTRALLKHRADANTRDLFGKSPLHDATLRGNGELVALLLEYGGDPEAVDESGTTPLHLAAHAGNEALVKVLLSHGANPRTRNWIGATPYDEAQQQGYKAILRQLTDAGPEQPGYAATRANGNAGPVGR